MPLFPQLKRREFFLLILILAAYLGITLLNLTRLPIFVDEALYLRWAQIAWKDASWRFISLTDGKQPLYIWLVIPFMKLVADPLAAGRLASVFSGFLTVLGMGYFGYLVAGKRVGYLAMLLSVFSPYLYFYYRFGIMEATLVASVIWVVNLSILLARTKRLDVALILGMATGLSLLVKSSALFFCLMIPLALIPELKKGQLLRRSTLKYLLLVMVAWGLSYVIYNLQRLSPWMHMIAQKNAFFTVSYDEIFANPLRLWNNFLDVWRWQLAYSTLFPFALFLFGLYTVLRRQLGLGIYLSGLLFGPVLGTVAVANLFAPRYIIYATPFVLIFTAYGLARLRSSRYFWPGLVLTLAVPLWLIAKLAFTPLQFPYVPVDEGYVNGWSAGNGTKQIGEWASARAASLGRDQKLVIYTEGTFGILPHGLELYTQGVGNLEIIGVYPLRDIPPAQIVAAAFTNPETYLVLNNTETPDVPAGLELVASYPKLRDNPMRLFRVIPR